MSEHINIKTTHALRNCTCSIFHFHIDAIQYDMRKTYEQLVFQK